MNRNRRVLATSGLVLVVLMAGWAAYRSTPNAEWACQSSSPITCQHNGVIELDGLDFVSPVVQEIDVNPDGTQLAVALADADRDEESAAAALVDPATGGVTQWLIRDTSAIRAEDLTYSPDGSLVAIYVLRSETTDLSDAFGQIEVYATETADLVHVYSLSATNGCIRLGFSFDNSTLQCGSSIIDVETGETIEQLANENRFAVSSFPSWAWGPGDLTADTEVGALVLLERELGWEPGDPQESTSIPVDWRQNADSSWLAFDRSGSTIAAAQTVPTPVWHEAWRQTARNNPPSTITLFDVASASVTRSIDLDFPIRSGGWEASGSRFVVASGESLHYAVLVP